MNAAGKRLDSPAVPIGAEAAVEARQNRRPSRRQEFEEVALDHLDRVYRMALRFCCNRTEAEDLVQETYLRAFRHFDQFQPGTNCRAWLFAILRNTFLNRVKREGRQVLGRDDAELDQLVGEPLEGMATFPNPEDECFKHVVAKDLIEALDRLPVPFREAVLLADVEGCSYKEIALVCGVPIGTVMSRLFRGRQRLQKTLTTGRERLASGTPRLVLEAPVLPRPGE